jgi:RNA polymerase sigma-70 factor (ECF subfamily)
MSEEIIEEKLRQCQQGQAEGFSWLARQYGGRLYRYFYRVSGSEADAEDLLQELYVKLIDKIGSYRHEGKFEHWLFSVAANMARDRGRRLQREAKIFTGQGDFDESDKVRGVKQATPQQKLEQDEQREQLLDALAQLPEMDREIILQRHYGQMSFKEIAEQFQIPIGTALAKVHRGLKRLQRIMSDEGKRKRTV